MKAINPMYSTYRAPIERSDPGAVTIREIEDRLAELNPTWSPDAVQIASVLFAILKEGCSTQKLLAFTRYPSEFLMNHVEHLRQRGELFTGSLSTQFVLRQCPGSEDLIELITGQRVNVKEKPKMSIAKNGHASAEAVEVETCGKSEACNKPNGHMGRCRGAGFPREGSVKGAKSRRRKQAAAKVDKPLRSAPKAILNGHELQTTPDRGDGLFKIEYEDETLTIKIDGAGRQLFLAMTEIIHTSLTGGLNG